MSLAGSNPALSAIKPMQNLGRPALQVLFMGRDVRPAAGRGAGVADRARLEIVCARKRTVGSNPTLSAMFKLSAISGQRSAVGLRRSALAPPLKG